MAVQTADALLAQGERERESIQWLAGALGGAGISIGIGVTVAGVGNLNMAAAVVSSVAMIATFVVFAWALMKVFNLLRLGEATDIDSVPEGELKPEQKAVLSLFQDDSVRQVQAIAQSDNRAQAIEALAESSSREPDPNAYNAAQRADVRGRLETFAKQAASGGDQTQADKFTDLIAKIQAAEQEFAAWQQADKAERQARRFLDAVRSGKKSALWWLRATLWVAGANLALALVVALLPAAQPDAKPIELSPSTVQQLTVGSGTLELDPSAIERLGADNQAVWVDAWLDPTDDQRLADQRGVSRAVSTGCTRGRSDSIGAWLLSGTPRQPRLLLFEKQVDGNDKVICEPAFFTVPDGSRTFVVPTRTHR